MPASLVLLASLDVVAGANAHVIGSSHRLRCTCQAASNLLAKFVWQWHPSYLDFTVNALFGPVEM